MISAPTGSPAERFTSREPEDFLVPHGREEEWRFTPVRRIRPFFQPFDADAVVDGAVKVPDGASVSAVDPHTVPGFGTALTPADRITAIAMQHAEQGLWVRVEPGSELAEPILVERVGHGGRGYVHHVVEIGANARAVLVLDHRGSIEMAGSIEYLVGDGAELCVVSIQDNDDGSIQIASHAALVGRDAGYRHFAVTLGGSVVRIAPTVSFAGPGGRAELYGLSFAGPGQHFESRLYIEHAAPHCTSRVLYKNAVLGETARTVWVGDVRIRPSAIGTDTFELNRNLLLSDGARADSIPNLEIETGEIAGAGHASATGRFDDMQLFYLQSRGIPEDMARRLVVRAFFADVVERIGLPDLEQRLMMAIEARLRR